MIKNDPYGMVKRATKKAFARVKTASNVVSDPDLALYGTLKSEHFTQLMKVYGEQPIIDYIRTMEAKRMGVNTGGNNAY